MMCSSVLEEKILVIILSVIFIVNCLIEMALRLTLIIDSMEEKRSSLFFWKRSKNRLFRSSFFPKNYADSTSCLRELSKILECRETKSQIVIPVFYKVDPAEVQTLRGSFVKGLVKLEKECSSEEMDGWKHALQAIADLKGWDSNVTKPDTKLVDEIVADIQKKLHQMPSWVSAPSDSKYLVGIDSRIYEVESLLCIQSPDVIVLGMWGRAGIGKTTIAEAVYSRNSPLFEGSFFSQNVREESQKHGVRHVRNEVIRQVLQKPNLEISMTELGKDIKKLLQRRRVLIVLDDVSSSQQLETALGEDGLFGEGSKIIVTSRDRKLLEIRCCKTYNVKALGHVEASQLFKLYAFKGNECPEGFKELSERAVSYTEGHPLSLMVLGSSLYNKSLKEWEAVFANLKGSLDPEIQKILMLSYDGLDWKQKRTFLDIACFFKRCNRDLVQDTLDQCGFDAKSGVARLIDLGLLDVSENNEIWMHDLLLQLGQDIVLQENFDDPRKRSRLWIADDIDRVFTHPEGTETVQSISLNLKEIDQMSLSPTVFKGMYNLRLLELVSSSSEEDKLLFPEGLTFLPKMLRVLRWDFYPLRSLPSNFCPKHLVEFRIRDSKIVELWNDGVPLVNLRPMEVSSAKLVTINPAMSHAYKLEVLDLTRCRQITTVDLSNVPNLEVLNLTGCINITTVDLSNVPNLQVLNLTECRQITTVDFSNVPNLEVLNLRDCGKLVRIPSSIRKCTKLTTLDVGSCRSLKRISSRIACCKCLVKLDLSYCVNLTSLPDSIGFLVSLTELDLSSTYINSIPASIKQLTNLSKFRLAYCSKLQFLPELPSNTLCIHARDCSNLKSVEIMPTQVESGDYEAGFEIINFSRCRSLDETSCIKVMGDAQLRIQRMTAFLSKKEYCFSEPIMFKLIIPGERVPEWFSYKNQGSSLKIIEPPACCFDFKTKTEFLGFAFCAVVVYKADRFHGLRDVICVCNFITKDGHRDLRTTYSRCEYLNFDRSHVLIWYDWSSSTNYYNYFNEASFNFYGLMVDADTFSGDEDEDGSMVVECGVHPLFTQDDGTATTSSH